MSTFYIRSVSQAMRAVSFHSRSVDIFSEHPSIKHMRPVVAAADCELVRQGRIRVNRVERDLPIVNLHHRDLFSGPATKVKQRSSCKECLGTNRTPTVRAVVLLVKSKIDSKHDAIFTAGKKS